LKVLQYASPWPLIAPTLWHYPKWVCFPWPILFVCLWSFHHFGSAGPLINHPSTLLISALDSHWSSLKQQASWKTIKIIVHYIFISHSLTQKLWLQMRPKQIRLLDKETCKGRRKLY
jgi:hypothetical protein